MRQFANHYVLELSVLAAMALRLVPEPYNLSSFLLLALVAFAGRTGTMFALVGVWFAAAANPGMVAESPLGAGSRYVVIAAALIVATFRASAHKAGDKVSFATASTAGIACAMLVHSALFSAYPSVSIFKTILWGAVSLTMVSTIRGMTVQELDKFHRFLLFFFALILVLSLAVSPLPEARLRNNVGLQGILNHPQTFGVFCALAGAYHFGTAMASPRPPWFSLVTVVLALQGVIESGARAGGFALVLGCVGLIGVALVHSTSFFRANLPGLFSGRFGLLAGAALLASLINSDAVQQTAAQFVRKNSRADEVTLAYDASRGFIIRDMMDNIQRYPAQGIGFGIQSATHLMNVKSEESTGVLLSAPVEKGVAWIALFEELGLLLGTVILGWILWTITRGIHAGAAAGAAVIAYFFTNFAEATFFSPGGIGMLGLTMFYLGMAARRETS